MGDNISSKEEDNAGKHSSTTRVVSKEIFAKVYDSPQSLPGKYKWVTSDNDVRKIEELLNMTPRTIGAPLWVSGDTKNCLKCNREINWLDIIDSALSQVHKKQMIAAVILGDKKYVNIEAPRAIADVHCFNCKTPIVDLRSFKCHNWAYAEGDLLQVLENIDKVENPETNMM